MTYALLNPKFTDPVLILGHFNTPRCFTTNHDTRIRASSKFWYRVPYSCLSIECLY